jgi:putative ABC transport system permease protein
MNETREKANVTRETVFQRWSKAESRFGDRTGFWVLNCDSDKRFTFHIRRFTEVYMFKNYIKISVRNLSKHKASSLINTIGLTTGITCCFLILLYVQDELSYDRHHENAERIYRVVGESINPHEKFQRAKTPNPLAPTLKSDYPEVVHATRIGKFSNVLIQSGNKRFYEDRFFVAEPSVFEVFTLSLRIGAPQAALSLPNSVIITATAAGKYFGDEDPIGKTLTFENRLSFRVTGVLEDLPQNSHFQFDLLASAASTPAIVNRPNGLNNWNNSGFYTYVLLTKDALPEDLEGKFPAFVDKHIAQVLDDDEVYKLHLQPLTKIHHYSHLSGEIQANGDIKYVYIFSAIAFIILLIACVNYMNLATARSVSRAKEVGLRKALGAERQQVIEQFLTDSLFMSLVAGVLAIGLVELILPTFSIVVGRDLNLQWSPGWLYIFIALVGTVGFVSGSYPAFFLSAFQPVKALKGDPFKGSKQKATIRGSLVTFQFVVSMILIACTLTVNHQLNYMRSKGLGFNKDQVVYVPIKERSTRQQYLAIKAELLKNPSVTEVSFSSGLPGNVGWRSTARWGNLRDKGRIEIHHIMVDHDFVKLYEMEIAEGRDFSKDLASDASEAYILNEAAVRAIGWTSGLDKKFTIWDREGEVVGVVKDFHFKSLHQKIEPLVFHIRPKWFSMASLRVGRADLSGTLDFVERTWKTFSPNRPFEYFFLDEQFAQMYRTEERLATISGYFTFLALLIACLGLFGLASFVAEQRTKEIAIRKVLGASAKRVIRLLCKDLAKLLAVAALLASPLAYLTGEKWLQNFAYRIDMEWWILGLAGAMTLAIAVLAVSLRAIKVAVANPSDSLRCE